jgi:hypothetical protein
MILFATLLFGLSLIAVVALFDLKRREERSGKVFLPALRARMDVHALRMKDLMTAAEADLAKLPPEALHLARLSIHVLALQAARLARFLEGQAHRLADLVSHKHRFVRRAPRSEFLKKVIERKGGGSEHEDAASAEHEPRG